MNSATFLNELEKSIPSLPGVKIYYADFDAELHQLGPGKGMNASPIRFLRDAERAVVVRLEPESAMAQRGLSQLLGMSAVKYLKTPY
jgi:hypothetical protein